MRYRHLCGTCNATLEMHFDHVSPRPSDPPIYCGDGCTGTFSHPGGTACRWNGQTVTHGQSYIKVE